MPIDNEERERRRTLLRAHLAAENDHDLDRIMRTFSDGTEMLYNGRSFIDHESIRWAHGYFGWSSVQGAFAGARGVTEAVEGNGARRSRCCHRSATRRNVC